VHKVCIQKLWGLVCIAVFILSMQALFSTNARSETSSWLPKDFAYVYKVDLTSLGFAPRYVVGVSEGRVVIAGVLGGSNVVALLDVSDPYQVPQVLQVYPLTGSPTWVDVDGYPVTRIVVGSDRGEVLLLRVVGGEVVGYVHRVLGADFYVDKVYVVKGPGGSYKVVALVSEGGAKTVPCTNCYIYAFDENAPGMFRAGFTTGNVTLALDKVYVQDVEPLKVFTQTSIYFDSSKVFLAYTPANYIVLVLNISYVTEAGFKPAAGALIEVTAYSKALNISYRYGVNADGRGVARIPLPVIGNTVLNANLSIRDATGNVVWFYSFDPRLHVVVDNEVYLIPALLPSPPDTRNALKVFGTPPFMQVKLALLDITAVPISYSISAQMSEALSLDVDRMAFVASSQSSPIIGVLGSSQKGLAAVLTMAVEGRELKVIGRRVDYVGVGSKLIDVGTYPSLDYIIAAFSSSSSSKVRVYAASQLSLNYIYPFTSAIERVSIAVGAGGYVYGVVLNQGIQLMLSPQKAVPLLRNETSLFGYEAGYIDGYILPDLTTAFLVTGKSIAVVKNLNRVADSGKPTTLDSITTPKLRVHIYIPPNESMDRVFAVFSYPTGSKILKPSRDGLIDVENIIPGVRYSLLVGYREPYINNVTLDNIVVENFTDIEIPVYLVYREFKVVLRISDSIGDGAVVPYTVVLDNKTVALFTKNATVTFTAVYGSHYLVIKPVPGFENAYNEYKSMVFIDRDKAINITLSRKFYTLNLAIIDSSSGDAPIAPLQLSLLVGNYSISSNIPQKTYTVSFKVPYGNASIVIAPAKGFEGVYLEKRLALSIYGDREAVTTIDRRLYSVQISIRDAYGEKLLVPVNIAFNNTVKAQQVREGIQTLSIPYGAWILAVFPAKGFENVYTNFTETMLVDSDKTVEVTMQRAVHALSLEVVDDFGTLITPVTVNMLGPVNITQIVDPSTRKILTQLPYGNYSVRIAPIKGFENVYTSTYTNISLTSPMNINIRISRVKYTLTINVRDYPIGIVRGYFELYVNGTKAADRFSGGNVTLPYGSYSIQLVPEPAFTAIYDIAKPVAVSLHNATSLTITINRKLYTLTVYVREGATPIRDASVVITNLETKSVITSLITSEDGSVSTKLPYGAYDVVVFHPSYYSTNIVANVGSDTTEIVYMRPTIQTLIWRFMPLIATLIGIGIAVYIGFKIRALIARRLVREEEVF
jgi:hypothetical protein